VADLRLRSKAEIASCLWVTVICGARVLILHSGERSVLAPGRKPVLGALPLDINGAIHFFLMEDAAHNLTPDTQLFRYVFDASPIGIAVENLDGQPLFVNPAFCSMLGFSEEELRGKHCVDFSPPEDAEKDWALFQQLRAGSIDHYQLEKRYFRRNRSLVWGNLSVSLLKSRTSPLVLAMVEDITDKKLADEARFRHAAIVESAEDAIASVTLDGVIASWNAGAQRIFGYTESEAVGKSVTILVPPERPDEENKILETLMAGGRIDQFETVRVRKTGERINVSVSISPIKELTGKIVGFSGISRNITERKRAEERLREYEKAVEGAEDMIGVVDREYRFLLANRQYLRMRNLTREQVVGRFIPDVLGKEVFETVIKPKLDECFQGKVVRYEMKFSYPTVGERDLMLSYFPIEADNGTIDRAACILHDITDRKQAEDALSAMTRKLIEAQEQERSRIGRELHDDISQRLGLLAIELEQLRNNPVEVSNSIQQLLQETTALSDDVQALSHELHSSKLEYLGVVSGMKNWCREFSERQKMEVDFRSDVSRPLPFDIGLSLFRVLQEALNNAFKHSGVKRVEVQVAEQSNEVHLLVRDPGKGFDIEAARQGNGLGLTSMQERIRLINGTIAFESIPMVGTTIHVRVPFKSEHVAQHAAG
jgi:PAS domain S-box-containing protein